MIRYHLMLVIGLCLIYSAIGYDKLSSVKDLILSMIGENEEKLYDGYHDTIVEVPENYKNKPSIDLHGIYGSGKYMNTIYFDTRDIYFVNRILNISICVYLNTQHEETILKVICNCSNNKICGTRDYHVLPNDKWYCILLTKNMAKQAINNKNCNYTVIASDNIINRDRHVFLEYYVNETEIEDDRCYSVTTNNDKYRDISVAELIKKLLGVSDIEEELYSNDNVDYPFDIKKRSVQDSNNCRIYRKYINFRDIGLKWILHPPGIDYGYCVGECTSFAYTDSFLYSLLAFHYIDGIELKQCCSIQDMDDLIVHYRVGRTPKTSVLYKVSVKSCKCV
nr:transforming growth factor B [Oriental turtle dovepox virus]